MKPADLLLDAFGRLPDLGHGAASGLDEGQLLLRPALPEGRGRGNPVAWLLWHSARVWDDHVAGVAAVLDPDSPAATQVHVTEGYADRLALPLPVDDIGYGHDDEDVAAVRAPGDLLLEYLDAVAARTASWLPSLGADDLDAVVDAGWDPPVTVGTRLVSVLGDVTQHLGQAAYVRGLLLG
ncbi:DinB family protein [uncultured Nocardioides sp.]|uniref:mycothiol transferase n=1 Tax=uncultured Nocardioides sp. TaxID=198441 RepID=UPI002611F96C|nr:DinB family protein [uncultured Nocardioides sp.]